MVEPTAIIFNQMEQQGRGVRYLRMDNAGENIDLSKRIKSSDWKLPITVEFTARDTPQQTLQWKWVSLLLAVELVQ
jgi:hypothetical protein